MLETVRAKALWDGDRFSLVDGGGVYIIKTYKASGSYVRTVKAERRLTAKTAGFLGLRKRWKQWSELNTPIEEQDMGQEVIRVYA